VTQCGLTQPPAWAPRYDIALAQEVLVVRQSVAQADREARGHRWGAVYSWAKDPAIGNRMINTRSETAATKPAFRRSLRERRCLIVADGFYEWKREGARK
jgi:putative SOS response-associated peptidase YedK